MSWKRTADDKRATLPRSSEFTKQFLKDWQRLSHSGRYDLNRLKEAMLLIIRNEGPLQAEWRDHALSGNWAGYRECHIGGDFLLIYRLEESGKSSLVVFVTAGTHAELFS